MRLPVLLLVLFGLGSSVAAAAEPPDDGSDADFDADLDASVDASVDLDAGVAPGGPPPLPTEGDGGIPTGDVDGQAGGALEGEASGDAAGDGGLEGPGELGLDLGDASSSETEAAGTVDASGAGATVTDEDRPDMVGGRREPSLNSLRGSNGLFYTDLADVGGRHTVRVRLHTDFFVVNRFIYDNSEFGTDKNTRFRGAINIGYSPFKWGEVFFNINSSSNRNERGQPDRQEPATNLALGDMLFGLKGAHRFVKGGAVGLGGQMGVGVIQGAGGIQNTAVTFNIDALFTLDLRFLTRRRFPARFSTNIGWIYDNSIGVQDWTRVTDKTSREVLRFALGVNHSRVRMRYAFDFPIRLGKERQFGLDPIVELGWDVSTQEEFALFNQPGEDSPVPRSNVWTTLGLRANVVSGLHLDAAVDIGLASPNFEFGPPTPPYQVILGIGWSIDPKPVIKEVEVAPTEEAAPVAVLDGRIVGQVVDEAGAPIADAKVSFPGLTSSTILTDESGGFTSFRFPEGAVTVQVVTAAGVSAEGVAEVRPEEDTQLTITVQGGGAAASGLVAGTFTDDQGAPVQASLMVTGQGVNEPFSTDADGVLRLELPAGDYSGVASAPGFEDKSITFTVAPGDEYSNFQASLTRATPVETPNVSGNKKRLRVKRGIRYNGDAVSDKSHAILDEVAAFLKGHPEYAQVEIAVHTDDRGNPKKRSESRAESVRDYLVGKGVASGRLEAKGYGDSSPIAVNMTASGRAKNNRTELRVLQYTGE
ncbi:MAG: OmpA family protein [Myxococcales bacterium]|nr:OmpA family protein [Myxococcales bacterium]